MKRLKFNKVNCIGCQLCAQVCSAYKEGEYIPSKARIAIETYYDRGNLIFTTFLGHFSAHVPHPIHLSWSTVI